MKLCENDLLSYYNEKPLSLVLLLQMFYLAEVYGSNLRKVHKGQQVVIGIMFSMFIKRCSMLSTFEMKVLGFFLRLCQKLSPMQNVGTTFVAAASMKQWLFVSLTLEVANSLADKVTAKYCVFKYWFMLEISKLLELCKSPPTCFSYYTSSSTCTTSS